MGVVVVGCRLLAVGYGDWGIGLVLRMGMWILDWRFVIVPALERHGRASVWSYWLLALAVGCWPLAVGVGV